MQNSENLHTIICAEEENHIFLVGSTEESWMQLISSTTYCIEFGYLNTPAIKLVDQSVRIPDSVRCDVGPNIFKVGLSPLRKGTVS